jgi:transposase
MVIGFESTAHYHLNLLNYLTDRNFKCYLINPYMTVRFRSVSLRKAKNDNIDSRAISHFLSFEYNNLLTQQFASNELRELCLHRYSPKQNSTALKIKLISYLDRVFPELESVVGEQGLNFKAVRAILKLYPTAESVSEVRIDKLISLSSKASSNRYPQDKKDSLKKKQENQSVSTVTD